jgi:fatty acid desaturase
MSTTDSSKHVSQHPASQHSPEAAHLSPLQADEQTEYKAFIRRLHDNSSARALLHTSITLLYILFAALAVWTWTIGLWPLTIVIWLLLGNIGHSKLIAFHESSHGMLNPRHLVNEVQGISVGIIAHVPLSVYRYVHGQHHAHICSEKDLELWPFVNPEKPLWGRRLAAFSEIVFGYVYTPFHFLHGVVVGTNIPPTQMRRIYLEYAFNFACWGGILGVTAYRGWWTELLVALIVPGIISSWLQTIRKFTEHMGMFDCTVLEGTRTVVDNGWIGWMLSEALLHIDHHGTHHRYAKMPYYNLPEATPVLYERAGGKLPLFSTYWAAMFDMFRTLGNPRIGSQWLADESDVAADPTVPRTTSVTETSGGTRDIAHKGWDPHAHE